MKVFKFGGASVNSIERIKSVAAILKEYSGDELMIIISAMGKTTNGLEKVTEAFYKGDQDNALRLFDVIKQQHITTSKYLLVLRYNECIAQLNDFFTEVEWLLHDKPVREYDYYYDQIVCVGELISTCIVSHFLNEVGIQNTWLDVRDIIRTDANFRDAAIDWQTTKEKTLLVIGDGGSSDTSHPTANIFLTQGFIGATDDNESTTLGREGSDYTAAIFANILNAESLTIWKDVDGVMNADPKAFPDAKLIAELSFNEVIEMAFYGAQVIHPKTIKPLQNKGISLHVKSFIDSSLPGTVISKKQVKNLPPIIVIKDKQALIHLRSIDFSFVGEQPMMDLYKLFSNLKIKPNLIQTEAISVQVCMDDRQDKISQLAGEASSFFDVAVEKELSLLTIRHYNENILAELIAGKQIVLTQKTASTVQVLYR